MTITEISKKYDITTETLRYYERIGLIPKVNRDSSGYRDYTEKDEQWVYYAKALRKAGISIEAMIEYVELVQKGDHTRKARKELLLAQQKQLDEEMEKLQETLDYLRLKIRNYDSYIKEYEANLLSDEIKQEERKED